MENAKYMLLRSLMAGHPASTTAPAYAAHLAELVSMGLVTTTGEITPSGLAAVRSQTLATQATTPSAVKWRRRHYDLRAEYSGRTGFTGNRARRAGGVA